MSVSNQVKARHSYTRDCPTWRSGSFVHNDVHQVYDYCTTFAPRRTEASEKIVRQRVAAAIRHPYYWGLIMNLSPETPDELVHLVPELDVRSLLQHHETAAPEMTT